eukprot:CAMPEP_0119356124 /NCGR_PEP_ID=MMETSP1334-20130426/4815_1 /TAXON_ID=127549 /ORGANISM="Calcidiscus leptoporus, Strain RCC1130" /LENGTH=431 /DNA_ID=CAMNT_0007370095 /DNA_START=77 /DNA_END=1372 /DNA_ORIENTATION=-
MTSYTYSTVHLSRIPFGLAGSAVVRGGASLLKQQALRSSSPQFCADDGERHERWMTYAVRLAERGRLSTAPNPWVGCVLIDSDGETLLAEGFHRQKGGLHAEAAALKDARERGVTPEQFGRATVYVTLEPCHRGPGKTTPPCDEALVRVGIRALHIAVLDPDPTFGNGIQYLRDAGVQVTVGTAAAAAEASLRPYLHQRRQGRPWVVLKVASSVDGAIACEDGSSQWITGERAREHSQRLRAQSQAIIVGSGTAIADKPKLTRRLTPQALPEGWLMPTRPLLRVVLDGRGRLVDGPLLDTSLAPTLVCTTDAAPAEALNVWRHAGADVCVLPTAGDGGGVDLDAVLTELQMRGIIQAMVEGGGRLLGAWLNHESATQLRIYVGACALGSTSQRWIQAPVAGSIDQAKRFKLLAVETVTDDVCIDYMIGDAD